MKGIDVVFGGDLPIGAGVSSSAALECDREYKMLELSRGELAQLAQRPSHQFLGIPCGIMDQFASLLGEKDKLILLDCKDFSFETKVTAIEGCGWVMLNTTVSHNLGDSEYPLRVRECKNGIEHLRDANLG